MTQAGKTSGQSELARRVLYRDADLLVLDKPFGLPVHRGPKGGANLTDMLDALRFDLPRKPELAHRLDKDTSGCLVLGRHRAALARLSDWFRRGMVDKTYWAVVQGGPADDAGQIDLPLAPRDPNRGWWMKVDPAGLPSLSRYRVLGRGDGLTWLALEPVTGRTHQLRLHCAASGFPILGDAIYGDAPRFGGEGLHLQARSIGLPRGKDAPLVVSAEPPAHMVHRLMQCGWRAPDKENPAAGAGSRS